MRPLLALGLCFVQALLRQRYQIKLNAKSFELFRGEFIKRFNWVFSVGFCVWRRTSKVKNENCLRKSHLLCIFLGRFLASMQRRLIEKFNQFSSSRTYFFIFSLFRMYCSCRSCVVFFSNCRTEREIDFHKFNWIRQSAFDGSLFRTRKSHHCVSLWASFSSGWNPPKSHCSIPEFTY